MTQTSRPTAETLTEIRVTLLNSLLQCEISAVETYQRSLRRLRDQYGIDELYSIEEQHWGAANMLRARVHELGGVPVTSSGVWGAWPVAVEDTMRVVGG